MAHRENICIYLLKYLLNFYPLPPPRGRHASCQEKRQEGKNEEKRIGADCETIHPQPRQLMCVWRKKYREKEINTKGNIKIERQRDRARAKHFMKGLS